MRIVSVGHAIFAAVLVALGIQGVIKGDFTAVWAPVPKGVPHALAYACAVVFVGSGLALLIERAAGHAARLLLVCLLLWLAVFRMRTIAGAPGVFFAWDGAAETLAIVAAVWTLYATLAPEWDRRRLPFVTGNRGVRVGRVLYGLALLPFGLAHLLYAKETAALVPAWLPAHVPLAYVTGVAFLVAGVSVLTGILARLAAALSALEIGLFTVLVWVPIVARGSADAFQWSEFGISCALTAAGWVVADSYRGIPWLSARKLSV